MFIKTIIKSNSKKGKKYYHYRLVESYRIGGKPRHRTILNMGSIPFLDNQSSKRKMLSERIEDLIHGLLTSLLFPNVSYGPKTPSPLLSQNHS